MRSITHIGQDWTLFLDRDGVINHQKEGSYIFNTDEFIFYDGALESMPLLANHFKYIFIITNQRGIGKGLMTEDDLHIIHRHMQTSIEKAGGRIDNIYFCPATDASDPCRKPNPGMAFKAKQDFPDIDFKKTVMVGNSHSDMEFGHAIGAYNVFVTTTKPAPAEDTPIIDAVFPSLAAFANAIKQP